MLYVFFTAHSAIFIGGLQNFLSKKKVFLRIYSHLCYACSLILLSALRNAKTRELFRHSELSTNFYNQKNDIE